MSTWANLSSPSPCWTSEAFAWEPPPSFQGLSQVFLHLSISQLSLLTSLLYWSLSNRRPAWGTRIACTVTPSLIDEEVGQGSCWLGSPGKPATQQSRTHT